MRRHFFNRVLSFLPTLCIGLVALFAFRLLPAESKWEEKVELLAIQEGGFDREKIENTKRRIREQLGLNLPVFYFSVRSAASPQSIPDVFTLLEKEWIRKLSVHTGEPTKTIELATLIKAHGFSQWSSSETPAKMLQTVATWANKKTDVSVDTDFSRSPSLKAYTPAIDFHGLQNQFHLWIGNLLHGNLGLSWRSNEKVTDVIQRALANSVVFTIPAIVITFSLSYWLVLGMSGLGPKSKQAADLLIYLVDLMPQFGWALLFIVLFASGVVFSWFPSIVSLVILTKDSAWERYMWPYILPVAVLVLQSFPLITKQIDAAFQKTAEAPFVFTSLARGISEKTIVREYRMRYSLLPAITLFGDFLVSVVGGGLIVEVAFSIAGIGKLLTEAVLYQDYPVVTGIILLFIVVQMISYLITDILYYAFDPRISLRTR